MSLTKYSHRVLLIFMPLSFFLNISFAGDNAGIYPGIRQQNQLISQNKEGKDYSKYSNRSLPGTFTEIKSDNSEFTFYNIWDFENESLGEYTDAEIAEDFNYTLLNSHHAVNIVNETINGTQTQVLRITQHANTVNDGLEINVNLESDYNEIYLSYDFKFSKEFNSTAGGKLPGLGGLPDFGATCPSGSQGFRVHNMFMRAGKIISYHYDRTTHDFVGCPWALSDFKFNPVYFSNGTWYNITQRLVLNTFNGETPNSDGIKELWVDGRLIYQESNLKLVEIKSDTLKIDAFRLANFYGGNAVEFMPLTECYNYIDNIKVYMPVNDPISGHALHATNSILSTPDEITDRRIFYDSLRTTVGTLSNSEYGGIYSGCIDETYLIDGGPNNIITYRWNHSIGNGDYLFFYDGNTSDARLLRVISGGAVQSGQSITSTGRYLFVRFSTDRDLAETGWTGTISFSEVPETPSNLELISVDTTNVTFAWSDNSDDESGFEIQRTPDNIHYNTIATIGPNVTFYNDEQILTNSEYFYRVRAYNQNGYSDYSDTLNVYVPPIIEVPIKPEIFIIANIDFNSVELAWSDNSNDENGFQLQRADTSLVFDVIEYLDPNITMYSDSFNLQPSTYYYYRLRAFNEFGYSDFTDTIEAFTPPLDSSFLPMPPQSLSASPANQVSILSWSDNANNESAFIVKRADFPSEEFSELSRTAKNSTSFSDTSVQEGNVYYYVVSAINPYGESANSDKIRVSIPSINESNRIKDGQIVYYNFNNYSDTMILDCSGFEEPLDLAIKEPDRVRFSSIGKLEVNSNTIIHSYEIASKIFNACKQSNEITLECWIKSNETLIDGPVKIVSLENESSQAFVLGCFKDKQDENKTNYFINLTTASTNDQGKPDFIIDNSLNTDVLLHIAYTRDNTGTERLYVNGIKIKEGYRPRDFDNWSGDYSLLLANDFQESAPWTGDLYLCSVYNKALSEDQIWGNYLASPFTSPEFVLNSEDYLIYTFPNPANATLNISIQNDNLNSDISESYYVRLVNIHGDIVSQNDVSDNLNNEPFELPISSLRNGIYSLVLYNQDRIIDVKKIIIAH
jgi:hypothetical protein